MIGELGARAACRILSVSQQQGLSWAAAECGGERERLAKAGAEQ